MACFLEEGAALTLDRRDLQVFSQEGSPGYVVIDDMVVYVESENEIGIRTFPGLKWPGGLVSYQFASGVTEPNKQAFAKAAKLWSDAAGVSFKETASPGGYVLVESSTTENKSALGFFAGKQGQLFRITSWNNLYVIAHEIAHTLGMAHEHMRSDRDNYVKIHLDKVESGKEYNFDPKISSTNYSLYDYESVMHYSYKAFGKTDNGVVQQTISVRPPNLFDETLLGQRTKLSDKDKSDMKTHYATA